LQDYFASDTDAIQSVIADIQQLQTIAVDVALPDIANSLLAVKQFLSEQRQVEILGVTKNAEVEEELKPELELKPESESSLENIEAAL